MPSDASPDATSPLWSACDAWLRRATEIITESTDALNTLNVFPVSDSDTGSNLRLTLAGISQAVPRILPSTLDDLVQAAILSAHGNSGAIVAEMFTSVCRALERSGAQLRMLTAGGRIAVLLRTVATAATQAVARPVAGTILTVADEAAASAERAADDAPENALAVAQAAQAGARVALAHTTEQLEVLQQAGVVDAGGQAYVLLLDVLVEVLGGAVADPLEPEGCEPRSAAEDSGAEIEYEVMYALRGADAAALNALRTELSELGNSVVVVGDRVVAQVHVHLPVPGAAVESGLSRGTLSQVRITALTDNPGDAERGAVAGQVERGQVERGQVERGQVESDAAESKSAADPEVRAVISIVAGVGLSEAVAALGGIPLRGESGPRMAERLTATLRGCHGEVVVLPNDMENLELARHVVAEQRTPGRRMTVIPSVAQVQGLAAIAVHEPAADFDTAVVAMSSAAGHARHGAVTIAEAPAMTMAGRCETGDVLGIVDGDFVVIGDPGAGQSAVPAVAATVVDRLLGSGGELLTLVTGAGVDPGVAEALQERVRHTHDAVEVQVLDGGQDRYLLLMGVE